jgi:hypothetical protein
MKPFLATWRSGYAAACKAVYTGSIPVVASNEKYLQNRSFWAFCGSPKALKNANSPHLEALRLALTSLLRTFRRVLAGDEHLVPARGARRGG